MDALRVGIVGLGRAGSAVAAECVRAEGVELVGAWNRGDRAVRDPAVAAVASFGGAVQIQADVILLAVHDRAVPEVAASLDVDEEVAVMHLSGAADVSLLAGLRRGRPGCWHPLQSFAGGSGDGVPPYAVALQGDPIAVARGRTLAERLGHPAVELAADGRAAYHAAAVLASNCLVALEATAVRAMQRAGVSADDAWRLLWPLVRGTIGNLEDGPAPATLTGPIARGDAGTVERNLAALAGDSGAVDVYRALGAEALALSVAAGLGPAERAALLEALACASDRGD